MLLCYIIKTIKLMASVGFAKLLRIKVQIYSKVDAALPPKKSFKISIILFIVFSFY